MNLWMPLLLFCLHNPLHCWRYYEWLLYTQGVNARRSQALLTAALLLRRVLATIVGGDVFVQCTYVHMNVRSWVCWFHVCKDVWLALVDVLWCKQAHTYVASWGLLRLIPHRQLQRCPRLYSASYICNIYTVCLTIRIFSVSGYKSGCCSRTFWIFTAETSNSQFTKRSCSELSIPLPYQYHWKLAAQCLTFV